MADFKDIDDESSENEDDSTAADNSLGDRKKRKSQQQVISLLASKILNILVESYSANRNLETMLLDDPELTQRLSELIGVSSSDLLDGLFKQKEILSLLNEARTVASQSGASSHTRHYGTIGSRSVRTGKAVVELKKSISLVSSSASLNKSDKTTTPRPAQPRTNPNYINVELFDNKNGTCSIKNTYVKLDELNKKLGNGTLDKKPVSSSVTSSESNSGQIKRYFVKTNKMSGFQSLSTLNTSYFNDLTHATVILIGLLNKIPVDHLLLTSSTHSSVAEKVKIFSNRGKDSIRHYESSTLSKLKSSSHYETSYMTRVAHEKLNSCTFSNLQKAAAVNSNGDTSPPNSSSSNELILDTNQSESNNGRGMYSPSATSLSDLTGSSQQNAKPITHPSHLNQRLRNLRRSFNNNTTAGKKNESSGPKSNLSYMVSSNDLRKLDNKENSASEYLSLSRKPSESNLIFYNNIDLNTHHERSGGFLFLFGSKRRIQNQDLMIWSSQTIQKPLLKTNNKAIKKEACDLFKLIQMYMGDRKLSIDFKQYAKQQALMNIKPENSEFSSFLDQLNASLTPRDFVCLDIMSKGWLHPQLRDELYLQIIKQTTSNLNPQSGLYGWQLMAICLTFFPPTLKLYPFLSEYISTQNSICSQITLSGYNEDGKKISTAQSTNTIDSTLSKTLDKDAVYLKKLTRVCQKRLERIHLTGAKKGLKSPVLDEIVLSRRTILNPSLFGTSLEEIMCVQRRKLPSLSLPWIQTTLSEAVLKLNGAKTEGIFRVPGDLDEVNNLKVKFDQLWCSPSDLIAGTDLLENITDPHLPASLLKLWYRELHEPLIPAEFYEECITYCNQPDKCIAIIERLPRLNRLVFTYLIRFLKVFAASENVALTKMDSNNLSMVMAPNCLRCQSDEPKVIMENTKKEMQFLRNLIQHLDTSIVQGVV